MDRDFWIDTWEKNNIGFHRDSVHPMLEKYFDKLNLGEEARVFLPLCGKTLDIMWLISKRMKVVGVELSEIAVCEFFSENNLKAQVESIGELKKFSTNNIDIFCGDLFSLTKELIGPIDAIYDRAALVALPHDMRMNYTSKLIELSGITSQLLITFDYPQEEMDGPPFSISAGEVNEHYKNDYDIELLEKNKTSGKLKDLANAFECTWYLSPVTN